MHRGGAGMESLTDKIARFLERGYGSGFGFGSGSGYGYGSGYGSGPGSGRGSGSGDGYGISKINGADVRIIDDVQTIITSVHGGLARGAMLRSDLQLIPCFIAKVDGHFAHGQTAREAVEAARAKAFEDMPQEARIEAFLQEIKPGKAYPTMVFYDWHHRLTGSCEMGRKAFAADHGVNLDGKMTREEFFALTKDAYGASIIREAMRAAKEAEA